MGLYVHTNHGALRPHKPYVHTNHGALRPHKPWGVMSTQTMGRYVHTNQSGLLGTGKLGGGVRNFYLTPTRYTVPTGMILH